ncbi:hypothetical protein ACSTD8_20595 [Vibrio vulnificus]|uniref:hypothetical protein n=1 Tax=Vibrio vulnificus TaxID=672 RepID=UPI003ED9288C
MSSILKKLKNYNDDTFILTEHPIENFILENKVTYLYGLGLIMGADDEFNESEKRFIGTLIRTLDLPDELLDEVEQNSRAIDEDFIEQLKNTLTENNLVDTFFYDALMICFQDDSYCQTEQAVLKQLCQILGVTDEKFSLVEKTVKAIDSKNTPDIEDIDGEGYWKWKHLVQYNRINYSPKRIKISNERDLKDFIGNEPFSTEINLTEGDFWLSEVDIDKLFNTQVSGAGRDKTTIWLEGEENDSFDDECSLNDHTHELNISMLNLKSISNVKIRTKHSKLLVLTMCGDGNLFTNCELEDVSEIDLFKRSRLQIEAFKNMFDELY